MQLLIDSFNPATLEGLMCRNTISVGWRGEVYDCDFNQQLDMQWKNGRRLFLWDIDPAKVENRLIMTGEHCFGCTAGAGPRSRRRGHCRNIGSWPVRTAETFSVAGEPSGFQTHWAHRLQVYIPTYRRGSRIILKEIRFVLLLHAGRACFAQ